MGVGTEAINRVELRQRLRVTDQEAHTSASLESLLASVVLSSIKRILYVHPGRLTFSNVRSAVQRAVGRLISTGDPNLRSQ